MDRSTGLAERLCNKFNAGVQRPGVPLGPTQLSC